MPWAIARFSLSGHRLRQAAVESNRPPRCGAVHVCVNRLRAFTASRVRGSFFSNKLPVVCSCNISVHFFSSYLCAQSWNKKQRVGWCGCPRSRLLPNSVSRRRGELNGRSKRQRRCPDSSNKPAPIHAAYSSGLVIASASLFVLAIHP